METPSVSGSEAAVAKIIKKHMNELGFRASIDPAGNVIGTKGSGSPKVLLCGHMDTVSGGLPVSMENGIITGRGSVDAKGPLAALIMGGTLALESGFNGSLIVVGVVDEEGRNKGIRELIKHGFDVDYAVFGEPTNVNTLTMGYKGSVLIRVTIGTEPGHSSAPWLYKNAIEKGMELFWSLKEHVTALTEEKEGINALTANIRRMDGGESHGTMPSSCQMWVEFRVPSRISTKQLLEKVSQSVTEFGDANKDVSVDVEVIDSIESFMADRKNNLVKAFTRSIYSIVGTKVALVKKSGTGDMNHYGAATGKPCITYGPGDPHLDHTDGEHILVDDYLRGIEVIKQSLLTLNNLHL